MAHTISHPETFRANVRSKLEQLIGTMENEPNMYLNLEKGIFNYAIKEATQRKIVKKWENVHFTQLYVDKLRSIYMNLKNPEFVEQIKNKDVTPQMVAFMTHQEIKPSQWKVLIDRKIKRDASKYTDNIQASTDMYQCRKCKSKRCTYYEMQTRSADEPATIFITCLDCGKHWRS